MNSDTLTAAPSSDWPTGYERRECIAGQESCKWKDSKWVWRSNGHTQHEGHRAEVRVCLGVFKCDRCGQLSCPKMEPGARKLQAQMPCRSRLVQPPLLLNCMARTYHFTVHQDHTTWLVWEHHGDHDSHERPPGGTLSKKEEDAVDVQVSRHHDATAHQLRTGDTGPGSVPFPNISPSLANPRAARYQLSQSQSRQGILASPVKGGLSLLHSFGILCNKLKTPFIVDSSIHGPIYITLQTPFMNRMILEAVETWIEDAQDGPDAGRHGFVTDGDHSFFRQGLLLVSCVFSKVLNSWVPVLYSWIDGQDMPHHRPHFRHIFQAVVKHSGSRFDRKLLLHVHASSNILRSSS